MRKTVVAAMLLASAMAGPAFAQERDHGGGRDGGGQHQDGGQRGGGFAGGNPGGGQPRFQQPQGQPPQGRPGGDAAQMGRGPGGGPGGDRGQRFDGNRPGGAPNRFAGRPDGNGQAWQGQPGGGDHGRPAPGDRPGNRPDWNGQNGNGRPGGDRPNGAPGWNGGRPGNDHGWADGRPGNRPDWNGNRPDRRPDWNGAPGGRPGWDGNRPDRRPDWNGNRPGHGWNGDRYAGGNWNRGWRQDQRYNWQTWRSRHRDLYSIGRYQPPYGFGWGYRSFGIGYTMDPAFYAEDYWIDNPDYYRLPPAYGPYRWVRYYNDALLIDINSGQIVDSIPNFFY
jgi:hypothetical protein